MEGNRPEMPGHPCLRKCVWRTAQECRCAAQGYEYIYNVTNVEYTEFDRLGVADECLEGSQYSRYPANTNVLYIGLEVIVA